MIQLIKPIQSDIVYPTRLPTEQPSVMELIKPSSPLAQGFVSVLLFFVQVIVILAIKHAYESYKRQHTLIPKTPSTAGCLHISDIKNFFISVNALRELHLVKCR